MKNQLIINDTVVAAIIPNTDTIVLNLITTLSINDAKILGDWIKINSVNNDPVIDKTVNEIITVQPFQNYAFIDSRDLINDESNNAYDLPQLAVVSDNMTISFKLFGATPLVITKALALWIDQIDAWMHTDVEVEWN